VKQFVILIVSRTAVIKMILCASAGSQCSFISAYVVIMSTVYFIRIMFCLIIIARCSIICVSYFWASRKIMPQCRHLFNYLKTFQLLAGAMLVFIQ